MPKRLENALKRSAEARGIPKGSKRWKRYVYGTLAKVENARKSAKEK